MTSALKTRIGSSNDNEIRTLIHDILAEPASEQFSSDLRTEVVKLALQYYIDIPPRGTTDWCRYLAFSLRYLSALKDGVRIVPADKVANIMVKREAVIKELMFGSLEERVAGLTDAFEPSGPKPPVRSLSDTQQETFDGVSKKLKEGVPSKSCDRWSNYPQALVKAYAVQELRPARSVAVTQALSNVVRATRTASPDRDTLADLKEAVKSPLFSEHLAFATWALHDFDRREANLQDATVSYRKWLVVAFLSCAVLARILVTSSAADPTYFLGAPISLDCVYSLILSGVLMGIYMGVVTFIQIGNTADHIGRTRIDIQTLQELIESEDVN